MFSASQARAKSQFNDEQHYKYEVESAIRHKVACGKFECYFPVENEQQVYKSLVGKGFKITRTTVGHWYNEFEDDPKDHVFFDVIKVSW